MNIKIILKKEILIINMFLKIIKISIKSVKNKQKIINLKNLEKKIETSTN
jgi:hypothetical protein